MRVIAGSARSLALKTLPSDATRPTTDKIKETLFNILQKDIYDCRFLDLFSGSGAIGIEALSRGARSAWFIENNKSAVACMKENLMFTKLADRAVVRQEDVLRFLSRGQIPDVDAFDLIFMDPPYRKGLEKQALELLSSAAFVTEDTLLIIEAAAETDFSYVKDLGFAVVRTKLYKTNKHVFLQRIL